MKTISTIILLFLLSMGYGQSHSDTQEFTIDTKDLNAFHLYNRKGKVTVKGTTGQTASMKVRRTLSSSSSSRLEQAKTEIYIDKIEENDAVYYFIKSNDHSFRIDDEGYGYYNSCCDNWRDGDREVDHEFEITLEIPKSMNLFVSTHWKDLEIDGIDGDLYARTHHDNLTAKNLGGTVMLRSHHGDITANFTRNPSNNCSYKTHHGDIKISYQNGLSSVAYFQSHHGSFFTEFDWSPQTVPVVKTNLKNGTKYKMSNSTAVKIGTGGPEQTFKTWHGDIYMLRDN